MTATTFPEVVHGTDSPRSLSDLFGRHHTPRATVRRSRLLRALAHAEAPVAVLVAPAGYGKTTLLGEWCALDRRPFAWVTLEARHDDSTTLQRSVARALDDAWAITRDGRVVLVLDDAHLVRSAPSQDVLAAIATRLPDDVTVALAARGELPLPVARLRAQGLVTELRQTELAMTRHEASALFRAAGLALEGKQLDTLMHRTEGWPALLALAAHSLKDHVVAGPALARFGGSDRDVADYLRDEILADLSLDDLQFVLQASILDVLDGPLCDAVLHRSGSGTTLARLRRANFPLVALDRTAERFRHHRLLGDMMRTELRRVAPDAGAELHRRASAWHTRGGDRERAMLHALAAQETQRAGDLVWDGVPTALERGSSVSVEHWLSRFDDAQLAAHPRLALVAAGTQLAYGRGDRAGRWISAAAAASTAGELGGVTALRAALGRHGLAGTGKEARRAAGLLDPDCVCQALCGLLAGAADHLLGRPEAARRRLEDAAHRAAVLAPLVHALCLAQLALLELEESDCEAAARLSTRGRSQVARYGLTRYPSTVLVLAVSALVRAHRGRVGDARDDGRAAAAMLERLTDMAPWYEFEVQITLARAALRLSDVNAARLRHVEAERLAAHLDDAPTVRRWLRRLEADLGTFDRLGSQQAHCMTAAELRILRFLPTHLTFREIADWTYVSSNTVKTQANAVYRKLDVRSRSEAVARARELGLLDA